MFSDKIKTKNANINGKVFAIYEKRAAAHRRESSPGASPLMLWSKIRLELGWGRRDALPSFVMSISCGYLIFDATKVSDKMQTKTEKNEIRNHSRISKTFIQWWVSPTIAKLVIFP